MNAERNRIVHDTWVTNDGQDSWNLVSALTGKTRRENYTIETLEELVDRMGRLNIRLHAAHSLLFGQRFGSASDYPVSQEQWLRVLRDEFEFLPETGSFRLPAN